MLTTDNEDHSSYPNPELWTRTAIWAESLRWSRLSDSTPEIAPGVIYFRGLLVLQQWSLDGSYYILNTCLSQFPCVMDTLWLCEQTACIWKLTVVLKTSPPTSSLRHHTSTPSVPQAVISWRYGIQGGRTYRKTDVLTIKACSLRQNARFMLKPSRDRADHHHRKLLEALGE